ncbi:hypothetical protein NDU88_001076 [Pleurodeles waltl]|uniref:Uncharacterized protein n=1 Tax=Pleurodeles waltl TaxID=8319 RepID=A0AAV7U935_PLEWA|nr:hypothetical protein NDU88_001076 [Pleurodeles waltl]
MIGTKWFVDDEVSNDMSSQCEFGVPVRRANETQSHVVGLALVRREPENRGMLGRNVGGREETVGERTGGEEADASEERKVNASGEQEAKASEEQKAGTRREQKEDADKKECEATGEQVVSVTKDQEDNATGEEEGDDAREQGEHAAGKLEENRRGGEWKNEAVEEGVGRDHGRTSPTEEQQRSKKQDPEPSHVPGGTWLSQVHAQ